MLRSRIARGRCRHWVFEALPAGAIDVGSLAHHRVAAIRWDVLAGGQRRAGCRVESSGSGKRYGRAVRLARPRRIGAGSVDRCGTPPRGGRRVVAHSDPRLRRPRGDRCRAGRPRMLAAPATSMRRWLHALRELAQRPGACRRNRVVATRQRRAGPDARVAADGSEQGRDGAGALGSGRAARIRDQGAADHGAGRVPRRYRRCAVDRAGDRGGAMACAPRESTNPRP